MGTYLCGRKSKPSVQHGVSNIDITSKFLLEKFWKILHHTFQSSWLLEIGSRLVLVLGVDEFKDDTLVLSSEGLSISFESDDKVVGISREWRVTSGWIGYISLAITLRAEKRIQLIVFDIDYQTLRWVRFVPAKKK